MSNDTDTPKFQVYKYQDMKGKSSPYLDISDAYANNIETVLSFQYVPTGKVVYFKAFITALNESFNTSYKTETVFGRVDPVHTFSNIQRNISFTFSIPAASGGEAFENLGNVQQLAQFMYPTYEDSRRANTISESPLIRFKVMNIISSTPSEPSEQSSSDTFSRYRSYAVALGLLGTLNSISIDHNLASADGVIEKGPNVVLPKLITVTCDFTAIHEEDLGWHAGGSEDMQTEQARLHLREVGWEGLIQQRANASFANEAFPYGAVLAETEVAPAAGTAWDDAFDNDAAIADLEAKFDKTMNDLASKDAGAVARDTRAKRN
jgi:hypothetical protein